MRDTEQTARHLGAGSLLSIATADALMQPDDRHIPVDDFAGAWRIHRRTAGAKAHRQVEQQ
jgi:hypothetical protein